MRRLALALCCALLAVAGACRQATPVATEQAPAPAAAPLIELARGSEWDGFDSVHIPPQGPATLYRLAHEARDDTIRFHHETATLPLSPSTRAALRAEIERLQLFALKDHYGGDVEDGTQWLLRIVDGDRTLRVYCDNAFPPPLEAFAKAVDAGLEHDGLQRIAWRRMDEREPLPLQGALRLAVTPMEASPAATGAGG